MGVLYFIECAANYTVECIKKMMRNHWNEIDVKEDVMKQFVKRLDEGNKSNNWMCLENGNSWYKNDKGRGGTNWAWSSWYYGWCTRSVDVREFNTQELVVCI